MVVEAAVVAAKGLEAEEEDRRSPFIYGTPTLCSRNACSSRALAEKEGKVATEATEAWAAKGA